MHSSESDLDIDDASVTDSLATSSRLDNSAASELGFMIRAPIAVLATIPLLLGSFVWPWIVHKRKFVINKDVLAIHFQDQIQKPFFSDIKKEAEKTVEFVITRSSQLAQKIVNESLQEEQARFDRENVLKNLSVQDTISLAVDTVSSFWSLSATEAALQELQVRFEGVLRGS